MANARFPAYSFSSRKDTRSLTHSSPFPSTHAFPRNGFHPRPTHACYVTVFPSKHTHACADTVLLWKRHTLACTRFPSTYHTRLVAHSFPPKHAHAYFGTVFLPDRHTLARARFSFIVYTRLSFGGLPFSRTHAFLRTVSLFHAHTLKRYARTNGKKVWVYKVCAVANTSFQASQASCSSAFLFCR